MFVFFFCFRNQIFKIPSGHGDINDLDLCLSTKHFGFPLQDNELHSPVNNQIKNNSLLFDEKLEPVRG